MKVGIFDSGVGGLSVLHTLMHTWRRRPDVTYVYVADRAFAPYGQKSAEQVLALTQRIMDFLVQQNVDVIVNACHTSSGVWASSGCAAASMEDFCTGIRQCVRGLQRWHGIPVITMVDAAYAMAYDQGATWACHRSFPDAMTVSGEALCHTNSQKTRNPLISAHNSTVTVLATELSVQQGVLLSTLRRGWHDGVNQHLAYPRAGADDMCREDRARAQKSTQQDLDMTKQAIQGHSKNTDDHDDYDDQPKRQDPIDAHDEWRWKTVACVDLAPSIEILMQQWPENNHIRQNIEALLRQYLMPSASLEAKGCVLKSHHITPAVPLKEEETGLEGQSISTSVPTADSCTLKPEGSWSVQAWALEKKGIEGLSGSHHSLSFSVPPDMLCLGADCRFHETYRSGMDKSSLDLNGAEAGVHAEGVYGITEPIHTMPSVVTSCPKACGEMLSCKIPMVNGCFSADSFKDSMASYHNWGHGHPVRQDSHNTSNITIGYHHNFGGKDRIDGSYPPSACGYRAIVWGCTHYAWLPLWVDVRAIVPGAMWWDPGWYVPALICGTQPQGLWAGISQTMDGREAVLCDQLFKPAVHIWDTSGRLHEWRTIMHKTVGHSLWTVHALDLPE